MTEFGGRVDVEGDRMLVVSFSHGSVYTAVIILIKGSPVQPASQKMFSWKKKRGFHVSVQLALWDLDVVLFLKDNTKGQETDTHLFHKYSLHARSRY